jgi:hypothetical protein
VAPATTAVAAASAEVAGTEAAGTVEPTGTAGITTGEAGAAGDGTIAIADIPAAAAAFTGVAAGETAGSSGPPSVAGLAEVSVVPGIARYHRADCILIRFLGEDDLERMAPADAEAVGCVPCKACRPDQASADG